LQRRWYYAPAPQSCCALMGGTLGSSCIMFGQQGFVRIAVRRHGVRREVRGGQCSHHPLEPNICARPSWCTGVCWGWMVCFLHCLALALIHPPWLCAGPSTHVCTDIVVLRGIHSRCHPHHPLVLDVGVFGMHEVHGVRHSGGEPLGAGDMTFGACVPSPPRTECSCSHSHSHPCAGVHGMQLCVVCHMRHHRALSLIHPPRHCCMHWSVDW
jgi:hypothetical protein